MSFLRQNPFRASVSIALLAGAAALGACRGGTGEGPANDSNAQTPVTNTPSVPLPEPALGRAELLRAVAEAASAAALGRADATEQRRIDGRQFEVRIRFGCRGPAANLGDSWLGWAHDPEKNTLRVRASPTISFGDPVLAALGGDQVEAVEGFWIPRPWLIEAECPAGAATGSSGQKPDGAQLPDGTAKPGASPGAGEQQPAEPLPTVARIGVAQFFTVTDPRTGRRDGRAYEAVKTLEPGEPIASRGFDLVLSGRLRALPAGKVINCTAKGFDQPPECVVSASFDRVWIDQPGTGEVIAEWRAQ